MSESQQRSGSGASIIVQEVMEEEWTALGSEDRRLPSLWGPEGMAEVSRSLSACASNSRPFSSPPVSVGVTCSSVRELYVALHLLNTNFTESLTALSSEWLTERAKTGQVIVCSCPAELKCLSFFFSNPKLTCFRVLIPIAGPLPSL